MRLAGDEHAHELAGLQRRTATLERISGACVALLAKHVAHDKALSQLPGVVDHLTAPIQTGDLYSRPSQQARAAGSEACAAPIDAVVRDCQARLYPKDPRASAKPWAAAIASRSGLTTSTDTPGCCGCSADAKYDAWSSEKCSSTSRASTS